MSLDIKQAVAAIKNAKLEHRNWMLAKRDLTAALLAAQPGEIICLTGPSRAGKSRLVRDVCTMMYPSVNESTLPVLNLEIHNMASSGRFTSRTFYSEALNKIGHPFYAEHGLNEEDSALALRRREMAKESTLQAALEQSLTARKTVCAVFDEVQHLLYALGGERAAAGMLDSWKCLAAKQQLVIVLVGAYPILNVLNLSPHILGRTITVHLPRYYTTPEDLRAFRAILGAFSKVVPVDGSEGLLPWSQMLYEESLGCIGLLSKRLRAAVTLASLNGDGRVTARTLQHARPPRRHLEEMIKEIQTGEAAISPAPEGLWS